MNLKYFKTYVPNLFTLLNLFCGSVGVIFAVQVDLITSSYFVLLGILFDFFDGFFARKFNSQSSLGLQLDSLADMVTSGLIPGIFMMNLLQLSLYSSWPMWDELHNDHAVIVVMQHLQVMLASQMLPPSPAGGPRSPPRSCTSS